LSDGLPKKFLDFDNFSVHFRRIAIYRAFSVDKSIHGNLLRVIVSNALSLAQLVATLLIIFGLWLVWWRIGKVLARHAKVLNAANTASKSAQATEKSARDTLKSSQEGLKASKEALKSSQASLKSSQASLKSSQTAQGLARSAEKSTKLVAERAGWLTPHTVGGFTADEIKSIDTRAVLQSASLKAQPVAAFAPVRGAGLVLGVGQSFMAGSPNSSRLTMVPDQLLGGLSYRAKMLGLTERCHGDGARYNHYGSANLNPLTETLVRQQTIVSTAQRVSGQYHPKARGATSLPAACIIFERLDDRHQSGSEAIEESGPKAFDVALNVARGGASLAQIASRPAIDRTQDAIRVGMEVVRRDYPGMEVGHAATFERHGQNNEGSGTPTPQYIADHRRFRADVNRRAREVDGGAAPAPWIATQVSGAYGTPQRRTAQAQLSMALEDPDYFLATPDYPFPHFGKAKRPHPLAGDRHPTAIGVLMAAVYMAHARLSVQVLRQNWFPTHMGEAYFRGHYILVSFLAMVPPLRISPVCVSTTITMVEALGFDVEDNGVPVRIVGMPELVGELTFRIQCARELTNPIVGLASGSLGLAEIGAKGSGATNILDSQKLEPFFRPTFEKAYTDIFPNGFVDHDEIEDLGSWYETFEFGNWAAAQRRRCRPLEISEGGPLAEDFESEL